MITINMMGS